MFIKKYVYRIVNAVYSLKFPFRRYGIFSAKGVGGGATRPLAYIDGSVTGANIDKLARLQMLNISPHQLGCSCRLNGVQ